MYFRSRQSLRGIQPFQNRQNRWQNHSHEQDDTGEEHVLIANGKGLTLDQIRTVCFSRSSRVDDIQLVLEEAELHHPQQLVVENLEELRVLGEDQGLGDEGRVLQFEDSKVWVSGEFQSGGHVNKVFVWLKDELIKKIANYTYFTLTINKSAMQSYEQTI